MKGVAVDDLSADLASLKIDRDPPRAHARGALRLLRWLLVLGGLGALVLAGIWLAPRLSAQFFKTEVQTAPIVEVSPSVALTSLTATGYVIAERRSKVGASVPGRVAKVFAREGMQVREGDLLFELDAADQKSNLTSAQARLHAAEARVTAARASLRELHVQHERQRRLWAEQAAARATVEDLEARIGTSEASVQTALAEWHAAQAQLAQARVTLGHTLIRAPISGTVLDKPRDVGEAVEAHTWLLELADLASLVVEVDVPEARLSLVRIGGPCEVTLDAYPGKRLRGRVRELGKRVNRAKATVPVKVELVDAGQDVLPDMSARVSFLTEALDREALEAATKVVVPAAALTERGGRRSVFVVESGIARVAPVKLGARSGDGFELVEGPPPGTRVVMNPDSTLTPGQRVKERTD